MQFSELSGLSCYQLVGENTLKYFKHKFDQLVWKWIIYLVCYWAASGRLSLNICSTKYVIIKTTMILKMVPHWFGVCLPPCKPPLCLVTFIYCFDWLLDASAAGWPRCPLIVNQIISLPISWNDQGGWFLLGVCQFLKGYWHLLYQSHFFLYLKAIHFQHCCVYLTVSTSSRLRFTLIQKSCAVLKMEEWLSSLAGRLVYRFSW